MREGRFGAAGDVVSSSAAPAPLRRDRTIRDRRRGDQRGVSLIEMLAAVVLAGFAFLAVIGGLLTVTRTTGLNEKLQAIDTGLVSYGEILQTQVGYLPCPIGFSGNITDDYQIGYTGPSGYVPGANGFIDGGNGTNVVNWRRPDNIAVRVVSVRSWNDSTQAWNGGCTAPDTGVQLVRYQVTACPEPSQNAACPGGKQRFAEVVKRKSGPT